jgi:acetyl esterase/lipase
MKEINISVNALHKPQVPSLTQFNYCIKKFITKYLRAFFSLNFFLFSLLSFAQDAENLPLKETYIYKKAGDCEIKADVYKLADKEVHPTILWIHGGALMFGNRGSIPADQVEFYQRGGYIIVSIDYRLAPETKLHHIIEDVVDAYDWLRLKGPGLFNADPDRIAVVGNSAGGYLTFIAGYRFSPRPKALISFYGYGDITSEWTTRPSEFYLAQGVITGEEAFKVVDEKILSESQIFPRVIFYNYCRQQGSWTKVVTNIDPGNEPEKLKPYCPLFNVTADYPPTLLLHGDKDNDVSFEQSSKMDSVLEKNNVPHQFIRMEGFDHLFDKFPDGWGPDAKPTGLKNKKVAVAFEQVVAFLNKYVNK